MKPFDRFAHNGVKNDLERIKSHFQSQRGIQFGSSGDGELTLRTETVTAYVRKYRVKEGWRVVFWRSGRAEGERLLMSEQEVIHLLAEQFS
ncbi:hypothetical protein [Pseudomonas sp. NPDC089396]|uniref:hypothetical protein n=1 Tax=Pseudomonas sp. NPDC089396 TaxID=3364461 RepID=UPI0038353219